MAGNFIDASNISLIDNAVAFCFKEARLGTTGGSDEEQKKYVGHFSTIMRLLTSKDSDLSSCYGKDGENALKNNNVLKHLIFSNHVKEADKWKFSGHLGIAHVFGFCKTFKKVTRNLGFPLTYKTANLQSIKFSTIATDINVTIKSLYLFVPISIPNVTTQAMFNESIMNNCTITFDSCCTERKISNDGREFKVDIGSTQKGKIPNYLIAASETQERIELPDKTRNIAFFDKAHVGNYFVEIDESRYRRDGVLTIFEENSYLDQFRDVELF